MQVLGLITRSFNSIIRFLGHAHTDLNVAHKFGVPIYSAKDILLKKEQMYSVSFYLTQHCLPYTNI